MEEDELSEFLVTKEKGTTLESNDDNCNVTTDSDVFSCKRTPLTTKNAMKLLLEGSLKSKVCRYCLNVVTSLYEMDQVFQIGGQTALYKVTIRDMVASFYPFQVVEDPNCPTKICDKCLDNAFQSYLFTQQCERAGRALLNCFEDMYEKLDKLDPLERTKKRGRQKLNPNYNTLYTEHEKVIDYADPIINILNKGSEAIDKKDDTVSDLECPRCWQTFTSLESLINHEKIHPKSMWFHCRLCGKSFVKRHLYRKHIKTNHNTSNVAASALSDRMFKCLDCDVISETYDKHLQHIEKHKFKMVMEHLVDRKMDRLCTVCLAKETNMVKLDKTVNLHGGCPELTGHRSLYNILGSTMPEMNILSSYTGTKICKKCLDSALTSYIFLNQAHYVRNRLRTCIELMLNCLMKVSQPDGKIFVEISQNVILPPQEPDFIDENLLLEAEDVDESKLSIDVLEDEFRTKDSGSESDTETSRKDKNIPEEKDLIQEDNFMEDLLMNPARNVTRTYVKGMVNGLKSRYRNSYNSISNACSEFLTFKKKRKPKGIVSCKFTCPLCNKHFISDYFLRRHIGRHILKNVHCKICKTEFKSKFHLYEHTKMMHLLGNSNFSSCKTCGRTFVNSKKLVNHIKTHNTKECQLCSKIFATQSHYNSHMQRHKMKLKIIREKGVQTCSFCEKACLNDNELTVHVNKVHLQIKPYNCDMCERQFYSESNLNCHKRVHSMYSKEKCNFCGKNLKTRKALVIHLRKHIGVKPYKCMICTQSFYSQGKLKNHMRIFHGGKFCCKLCKTVFVTKYRLKEHVNKAHNVI
ncbi:zinc finger protein 236-like isoform X2 [Plodia interpunctella]|uniref:zinc finger protein 236-like isoform X2 n=1 Tax=Plodia interpunctella TaxID=58824 RepID=UPI002368A93B|nr:zinc finger protein 236-like isoform X2 [Plodia interpunctella]